MASTITVASLIASLVVLARGQSACSEYFQLVQQWGPTFCKHNSCTKTPTRSYFTIHGLWPEYYAQCNGLAYPSGPNCAPNCNCPYSSRSHSDLTTEMNTYWPSYTGAYTGFWQHEWDKHGTCLTTYEKSVAGTVTTQHDYFAKSLELRRDCNVLAALKSVGITPGTSAALSDFQSAITSYCGNRAHLDCSGSDLSEAWICYDKDFNQMDCLLADTCPSTVTLPA